MADIYTFVLQVEGPDPGFRLPDSCDINQIGRHFLMRSFAMPDVRRHYTVATCMKRQIYEEYVRVIEESLKGEKRPIFNTDVLQEKSQKVSEVIITLKDYHIPKGFSNRISKF
jgi:hypothetical protein